MIGLNVLLGCFILYPFIVTALKDKKYATEDNIKELTKFIGCRLKDSVYQFIDPAGGPLKCKEVCPCVGPEKYKNCKKCCCLYVDRTSQQHPATTEDKREVSHTKGL